MRNYIISYEPLGVLTQSVFIPGTLPTLRAAMSYGRISGLDGVRGTPSGTCS